MQVGFSGRASFLDNYAREVACLRIESGFREANTKESIIQQQLSQMKKAPIQHIRTITKIKDSRPFGIRFKEAGIAAFNAAVIEIANATKRAIKNAHPLKTLKEAFREI